MVVLIFIHWTTYSKVEGYGLMQGLMRERRYTRPAIPVRNTLSHLEKPCECARVW